MRIFQFLPFKNIFELSELNVNYSKPLDAAELNKVMEACDLAMELDRCKSKILSYVESRMTLIAPNLSIIVGAPIAAKLMGKISKCLI